MQSGHVIGRVLVVILAVSAAWGIGLGQDLDRSADRPLVLVAAIEGPIGPATSHHVERVLTTASERGADALVLRLNTPGGLATSMREILVSILASPVPVIGYVAPSGAHAASAGTYIIYATHVAAMAPGTNLGAATPVQIGGMPQLPRPRERPAPEQEPNERSAEEDAGDGRASDTPPERPLAGADAMTAKITNDAVAFIRSLAEIHGRNADWAERAVREAASLSASEALEQGVIDLMAVDIDALLAATDGRTIKLAGAERTLATRGAIVETIEPDTITQILAVLTNPSLAFILMMLGVYGIIYEFINPGGLAPGVFGSICLMLGLYALNQLPLDYAGLALIGLGIAFMVAEAMSPAFGILGFGGLLAFVLGSTMLIDTDDPAYQISWWLIGTMAVLSGGVLVLLLGATVRAYRRAPLSAAAQLAGEEGEVVDWSDGVGHVWIHSERWEARGPSGLGEGQRVRVAEMDGLVLIVDGADTPPRGSNQQG